MASNLFQIPILSLASIFCLLVANPISTPLWAQENEINESRIWSDSSGKFEVTARLISQDEDSVVLLTEKGREISVAKSRLSEADHTYLSGLANRDKHDTDHHNTENDPSSDSDKGRSTSEKEQAENDRELIESLKKIALEFYDDLRTKDRNIAIQLMSQAAQEVVKESNSELAKLPTPDEGRQSIRVGRPRIEGKSASVPVSVRVDKKTHRTILHLHQDGEDWYVTAISAVDKNEEKKIDFAASGKSQPKKDKLASLVGTSIKLTGVTLDGEPVSLSSLKGKVVLIDFWATWCGPCIHEIPNILENYEKYHDQGFEVLAVSVDSDLKKLKAFVKEEQPPWIVLADKHSKNKTSMASKFGISGIPAFILVDRDGTVYAVNCRGKQLGEKLDELFTMDVSSE